MASGLYYAPTGSPGNSGNLEPSNQISSNNAGDSFDIIFANAGAKSPVGVDLSAMYYRILSLNNSSNLTINVYDKSNVFLASTTVNNVPDVLETGYIGFVVGNGQSLGRINISAGSQDVAGADNIRVFGVVPEPGTLALLALGMVSGIALRRRK